MDLFFNVSKSDLEFTQETSRQLYQNTNPGTGLARTARTEAKQKLLLLFAYRLGRVDPLVKTFAKRCT